VTSRGEGERGFAIVAALWAAALLAIMTLSILQIVRADARIGRGREEVAALNAVADAAVNIAILSMLGPRATQPPVNAGAFAVPFNGYIAQVRVQDEAGKIDLNMANVATLRALLTDAGLDAGAAIEMANRVLARRGSDPTVRAGGGNSAGGSARRLQSVEDLRSIPGITADVYRHAVPLVTVYSQTSWIDPAFSSLGVLNVFRTIDPNAEAAWRRKEQERAGLRAADPSPGVALGHAFTITAEVVGAAASRVVRTATIRLTGQKQQPLLIYAWD
jgi:general secretion pathway protein K